VAASIARHPYFGFSSARNAACQGQIESSVEALQEISQELGLTKVVDLLVLARTTYSHDVTDQVERVVELLVRLYPDPERALDFALQLEESQGSEFARLVTARLRDIFDDRNTQKYELD